MKIETNSETVAIEIQSDIIESKSVSKANFEDVRLNIESDNDSGLYLNSSDTSLNACLEDGNKKCNNNDANEKTNDETSQTENSSWRLNLPEKMEFITEDELVDLFKNLYKDFEQIPEVEKRKWAKDKMKEAFGKSMTEPLMEIGAGHLIDGDSEISMDLKPQWLDMDKFKRGQRFGRDYQFGIAYAELISLFTVFSFDDGLKPLILTTQSSTPYTAFKRYLSTGNRVQNWYTSDPWTKNTPAYNDLKTVRKMHAMVRKKIESLTIEEYEEKSKIKEAYCPTLNIIRRDYESTCPAPAPGQCPYMIVKKFPHLRGKKLSQGEMASTQFAFVGLVILYPKFFGIHASEQDLEAFCHTWRGIGYLLGIEDEFNFCRGTLEDVRTRSRDFLEYWVKPNFRVVSPDCEHMMRCVVEGLQYYFPGSTYETCLLDLAEIMNLHMPRLYNSLSYATWIKHSIIRAYFNHGSKLPGLRAYLNRQLRQAIEKAKKFDEEKHKSLKEKSAKTLSKITKQTACESTNL